MQNIPGLRVEKVTTLNDFLAVFDEPEGQTALRTENIFLTPLWLSHWWQVYGNEYQVHALLVREGQELVGMLPLALRKTAGGLRCLSFMGAGELTPNDLDILAVPERQHEVLIALAVYLSNTASEWDVLDLDKLPVGSPTIQVFDAHFRSRGHLTDLRLSAQCFSTTLPASVNEFLDRLPASMQRNIRKRQRRLEQDHPDARFVQASTPEQVDHAFEALVKLHQARWVKRGYPGAFSSRRFLAFHRSIAPQALQSGLLRLVYLQAGANVIAVEYIFRVGSVVHDYLGGFDEGWSKYSPGNLLLIFAIQASIESGIRVFDFLEGDESYKQDWGTEVRENSCLHIFSTGWRSRLEYVKFKAVKSVKRFLIRILPKNIRRSLWRLYLRLKVFQANKGRESANEP